MRDRDLAETIVNRSREAARDEAGWLVRLALVRLDRNTLREEQIAPLHVNGCPAVAERRKRPMTCKLLSTECRSQDMCGREAQTHRAGTEITTRVQEKLGRRGGCGCDCALLHLWRSELRRERPVTCSPRPRDVRRLGRSVGRTNCRKRKRQERLSAVYRLYSCMA